MLPLSRDRAARLGQEAPSSTPAGDIKPLPQTLVPIWDNSSCWVTFLDTLPLGCLRPLPWWSRAHHPFPLQELTGGPSLLELLKEGASLPIEADREIQHMPNPEAERTT